MAKIILSIIVAAFLLSCYTQKKAVQQTEKAYNTYPLPVVDFFRKKVPCVTTDSSIVYRYVYLDSAEYYQRTIDSLNAIKSKVKDSVAIRYKDSCKSVMDNFNEGFDIGYKIGFIKGKSQYSPDSVFITKTYKIRDVADSVFYAKSLEQANKEILSYKKKMQVRKTWVWVGWSIAFILALVVTLFVYSITKIGKP